MGKSIPERKAEFVCMCVREKKNSSFKIHIIILKYTRNVDLPFKKDFKFIELFTKTFFFLYFRDRPENSEADVEIICAKVTKYASKKAAKAEANLN